MKLNELLTVLYKRSSYHLKDKWINFKLTDEIDQAFHNLIYYLNIVKIDERKLGINGKGFVFIFIEICYSYWGSFTEGSLVSERRNRNEKD